MRQFAYLTQNEAAPACAKSYETFRRYRHNGHLRNSRTRPPGTVEVAVADLVASGLLDPLAGAGDLSEIASPSRVSRRDRGCAGKSYNCPSPLTWSS
jgi:hypothetical protein